MIGRIPIRERPSGNVEDEDDWNISIDFGLNSRYDFIALGLHEFLETFLIIIITGMEFKDTSLSRQNPKFLTSNVFIIP